MVVCRGRSRAGKEGVHFTNKENEDEDPKRRKRSQITKVD